MKFPRKKGNRIRASDKSLVFRFSAGSLFLLFFMAMMLLNLKAIITADWNSVTLFSNGNLQFHLTPYRIITLIISAFTCLVAALFYCRFRYDKVKQLFHRQKLARMILENGWYETETLQDSGIFKDLTSEGKRNGLPIFQRCITAWRMACTISRQKSRRENIKTSSYTWRKSWKQDYTVNWYPKSCMILTWSMSCSMTRLQTALLSTRYGQKRASSS